LNKLNKLSGLKIDFPELEETFDKKYNFKFKEVLKYPTIINSICD